MQDYSKLVKALRLCQFGECGCGKCYYKELKGDWCTEDNHPEFFDCDDKLKLDAAAAIEALQAVNKELQERIEDKMIQVDFLTADCTNYESAIEALQAQLPKQGEWLIHSTGGSMATKKCPFCGSESWQSKEYAKVPKYCQNCGAHLPTFEIMDWVDYLYAKTEVQE